MKRQLGIFMGIRIAAIAAGVLLLAGCAAQKEEEVQTLENE